MSIPELGQMFLALWVSDFAYFYISSKCYFVTTFDIDSVHVFIP